MTVCPTADVGRGSKAAAYFCLLGTKSTKDKASKETQAASSLYMRILRPGRFSCLFGVARSGLFINITGSQGGENANRAINGGMRCEMRVVSMMTRTLLCCVTVMLWEPRAFCYSRGAIACVCPNGVGESVLWMLTLRTLHSKSQQL